jgi:hypothetical protein
MIQNALNANVYFNIPHLEASNAKGPNAWVPTHELFLCQRFRYFEISKVHKLRI